jgi:hypothetical protein
VVCGLKDEGDCLLVGAEIRFWSMLEVGSGDGIGYGWKVEWRYGGDIRRFVCMT